MTLKERFESFNYRGPGFDLIRLLAASVVVVHHSTFLAYYLASDAIAADPLYRFSHGYIQSGYTAVAVFFVVSGFLVTPGLVRSRNVIDFAMRRIVRIYPLLILITLTLLFIVGPILTTLPLGTYFTHPETLRFAKNMLPLTEAYLPGVNDLYGRPVDMDSSLWTLFFEVGCYAALGLASVLGLLRKGRWVFAGLFFISFVVVAVPALGLGNFSFVRDLYLIFIGLFMFFSAGVTLYLLSDIIPWSHWLAFAALVLGVVAMRLGLGALVVPEALAYLVVYLGLSRLPFSQRLENHDLSYGVYLVHGILIAVLIVAFPQVKAWWVVFLIIYPISLALAFLTWTFIEHPILSRKSQIAHMVDRQAERISIVVPPIRYLRGRAAAPATDRPTLTAGD